MAIITSGITTLTDLNDAIISGTQPVNPTAGTLWIDSSKSPAVLKIYKNGAWVTQDLDLNSLDPNMAESIRKVVATIGNMSNDNLLDFQERQQIKDDLTEILGKVMLDTETVLPTVSQLDTLAKGSFYSTRRNALNAGIETNNSIYVDVATQYQNLKTYLESLTPIKPWNVAVAVADKDKNVTVVKNTFRDKWLQYYLATEKLSLATTEKIKEAQENLDGKIDEVSLRDKTEILSGNPVFTDKSDDAVVHVGVDGKSEQNVATGNPNLLLNSMTSGLEAINNRGISSYGFVLESKLTDNIKSFSNIPLKINTNYTISYTAWSEKAGTKLNSDLYPDSLPNLATNTVLSTSPVKFKYTISASVAEITNASLRTWSYNINDSSTISKVYIADIKIEEGSTATPIPTPSPDYPSEIKSLNKNFDIVSSVGGRNLLIWSTITSGYVEGGTGRLVSVGGANTAGDFYSDKIFVKGNESLVLQTFVMEEFSTKRKYIYYYDKEDKWISSNTLQGTVETLYAKAPIGTEYVRISGTGMNNFKFKLEKGSTATPYSQAPEDITYNTQSPTLYKTNILLSEPLRSVGDIKDRLFLDTDGLWKIERNVGELVIDKDVIATINPSFLNVNTMQIMINDNKFTNARSYGAGRTTNNFGIPYAYNTTDNSHLYMETGRFILFLNKSVLETQDRAGAIKLFTEKPLVIQYLLATPTIETLSAEQQTKLNNIPSYKNSTYVYILFPDGQGGYY